MKKESLLIVENEKIIALDLQKRLERYSYTIAGIATSGEEALRMAEEYNPDIILMDIMLSGPMDGIDTAMAVKTKFQIPVIFLTAYADEITLERAKRAEPFGYILKPFKEKELYTTIDIALYKNKIDKKVKRQERWSSAILRSIGDGIVATDRENRVTFMNPIAEGITEWSEKQATGRNIAEILQLSDEKTQKPFDFPEIFNSGQTGAQKTFKELLLKNRTGETILVEGNLSIIQDKTGNIEGNVIAFRDITEKRALSETINYQANHDALTGLINRNAFSKRLSDFIESARQDNCRHALLYLDLDQFNLINDSVGQSAGDDLLLEATAIIKSVVRGSDVCARIGGDEFGIILGNSTPEQAKVVSQRLHSKLAGKKLSWGSQVFNIHSSIGLVMIEGDGIEMQTILAAASDACTLAKDEGGRRIKYYTISDTLFQQRQGEMQWVSRLMKVLEENRFRLYLQPIVPLQQATENGNKYEILVRMLDDHDRIVSPARFIPAAEKYHFMPQLDRWIIAETLQICGALDKPVVFSINLSAQSVAEENFLDYIYRQFDKYKVDPKMICFEITETAAISNMATASSFIENLKNLGCTFALDDFGSGFSSFNYLKNMPIDFLKIDGSFVRDMDKNPVNSAMVEAMNTLGHIMGVKTIAEFVCNSEIKAKLIDLKVDFAQGFELAEPKPISELL